MKNSVILKKFLALATIVALLACLLSTLVGCFLTVAPPKLDRIVATYKGPALFVGQNLNKSDVEVTAYYTDDSSKKVTEFTVSELDLTAVGTQFLTVSYTEDNVTRKYPLAVEVVPIPAVSLVAVYDEDSIEIGGQPDVTKLKVTVYYQDGSSKLVTNFAVGNFDSATAGLKDLEITYEENGVTLSTVVKILVIETGDVVEIIPTALLTVYDGGDVEIGAQPDASKLTVTVYYNDGSNNVVTNFSASEIDTSTAGEKVWEITYEEKGIKLTATVKITVVEIENKVADISIHFLELGNANTGDSVYIKAGDTDILIDAGSRGASAATISKYVDQYCTDKKLEYVIATHAHQDHIEGFVGTSSVTGVLDYYQVDTLIMYARTNSTSNISKEFAAKVQTLQQNGVNVYTADQCVDNSNDIPKIYDLAEGITLEILDQKFYRDKASDENDYSVCAMITQGDNHYLFTGDLEEKGEASLVALNPDLPQMELYKGGHHGSYTAANTVLLNKIRPKHVCICCCAGNVEYLTGASFDKQDLTHSFPAQEFIDRVAPHTDSVYVTTRGFIKSNGTKWVNDGYESMNGNITFTCIKGVIEIHGSNNDLKLKDTEWFKNNRTCPAAWQ